MMQIAVRLFLAAVALVYTATTALAQAPGAFAWYGQVVAVDAAARTLTLKVDLEPPVARYAEAYKPGDPVVLTWTVARGDAITVRYLPRLSEMEMIRYGFTLPATFESLDAAARTAVVRVTVPQGVDGLGTLVPGRWVKAMSSPNHAADVVAIASLAATDKPAPKPPPVVETPKSTAKPGLPGTWAVDASLAGNSITTTCTIEVDGEALAGTCKSPIGEAPLTGTAKGKNVNFTFKMKAGGNDLEFEHTGELDAAGTGISGLVKVMGMSAGFSATKK